MVDNNSNISTFLTTVVSSASEYYRHFTSSMTEELEDEDSDMEEPPCKRKRCSTKVSRFKSLDMEEPPHKRKRDSTKGSRIKSFVEYIIPRFTDTEFQSHFRLSPDSFDWLYREIRPLLINTSVIGRQRICPRKQLLSVLWLFATPDSFRSVASRFDMPKGTLHAVFLRVLTALNSIAPTVIKWPDAEQRICNSNNFKKLSGFEGVVGCIDGTYVRTKPPSDCKEDSIEKKGFYGITLQGICDSKRRFIDCFAGYPSSVPDVRVFRKSDIYKEFMENYEQYLCPHQYLLGDKAYEPKVFCVPPYIERGPFPVWQKTFNTKHAVARQVIENTFGLLFGRFKRFQDLDMARTDLIPAAIIAACVLHNVCLLHPSKDELQGTFEKEGLRYLRELEADVMKNYERALYQKTNNAGVDFRDQLAEELGLLNEDDE